MFEILLNWMTRHEITTIIISSIIGSVLGLLAKDCIKALLQTAIDLL